MAKKRKKTKEAEEEKYEFVPPEFDEKQFLIDEMRATKRILFVLAYAIVFGVIAAVITVLSGQALLGLLMAVFGLSTLKMYFTTLKIDLSKFTRRNWFESGIWFFFTFLAIWVLVVNPPFIDYAPPDIKDIKVTTYITGTGWIQYNYTENITRGVFEWRHPAGTPNIATALSSANLNGTAVNITARVVDNMQLSGIPTIYFRQNKINEVNHPMVPTSSESIFSFNTTSIGSFLDNGYFTFRIVAHDASEHVRVFEIDDSAEVLVS
ncbi:MAG: hypothetical protein OEV21_01695 [Thermoplasmata archaeon]|nr:hypothetical protein [Thermoplasmata archaeon]